MDAFTIGNKKKGREKRKADFLGAVFGASTITVNGH
jgi:hypothetical protein